MNNKFVCNKLKVLLLEGVTDCHVISALCKAHNLPHNFGLHDCGSVLGILKQLGARIKSSQKPEVLGIVIDADKELEVDSSQAFAKRWQQLKGKLKSCGYEVPESPKPGGTIIEQEGLPKVGFWLMPDNRDPGMLEDFLLRLALPEAAKVAEEAVERAESEQVATFIPNHRTKAIVHTYLAWQDEPGRPLGQSITAHTLKADHEIARAFTTWLKELFS